MSKLRLLNPKSFDEETRSMVSLLNSSAIEISKISRLPLACFHLTHPGVQGMGIQDSPVRAPLVVFPMDHRGVTYSVQGGWEEEGPDLLFPTADNIATHVLPTAKDYKKFMERGGIATRLMSVETAKKLSLAKQDEEGRSKVKEFIDLHWKGLAKLPRMPEGFEAMHDHIHRYQSGHCWFYAEALARSMGAKAVALTLKKNANVEMLGSYHACVKTEDGSYVDIWGSQTLDDILGRFQSTLVKEEPMWDCLARIQPKLDQGRFEAEVEKARQVVLVNPIHGLQNALREALSPRTPKP